MNIFPTAAEVAERQQAVLVTLVLDFQDAKNHHAATEDQVKALLRKYDITLKGTT